MLGAEIGELTELNFRTHFAICGLHDTVSDTFSEVQILLLMAILLTETQLFKDSSFSLLVLAM